MSCFSNNCDDNSLVSENELRDSVRQHYAKVVTSSNSKSGGCCGASGSCFGPNTTNEYAEKLGYSPNDLQDIPDGSNLGLGCGNPLLFAKLKPGDVVVDLGSGAGFDAFIAVKAVGESGRVIGVDMTPEMITKSLYNAKRKGHKNVEFRLGELEHLPIADNTIDVIISNCVINLVPNKAQAFGEAFRVLKSGGRVAISDVVTSVELPESVKNDLKLFAGCLAGATLITELDTILKDAGFIDVKITPKDQSREFIKSWAPGAKLENFVTSALIQAQKP